MPPLPNPRHERFAQELAKGKSLDDAYRLAGYRPARQNAHRLMTKDDMQRRVAELQGRGAAKAEITLASLLAEAEEARLLAMKIGQPAAAIAAVKEKGVLSGMRVEKRENTNKTPLAQMTDAELEAIAAGRSEDPAPAPRGSTLSH